MARTWDVKGKPGKAVEQWRDACWDLNAPVMELAAKLAAIPGVSWDTAIVAAAHQEGPGVDIMLRRFAQLGLACLRDGLVELEMTEKAE
jgi:hypothetical protein